MSMAWHTAALVRWPAPRRGRSAKPFPKLDKLMVKSNRKRLEQTPEQMAEILKMWTVALGGTVIDKSKVH